MGTLEAFLVILAVISGGLVIWSYTKSGKKWLNSTVPPITKVKNSVKVRKNRAILRAEYVYLWQL